MLFKNKNRKEAGFTLAELLIVVAIIAVLVAVAIPVFSTQLERSRQATDLANIRSSYSEAETNYLTTQDAATGGEYQFQNKNGKLDLINTDALSGSLKTAVDALKTGGATGTIQVAVNANGEVTSVVKVATSTTP